MSEPSEYLKIESKEQYQEYRSRLKNLLETSDITADYNEIDRLTFLLDQWTQAHSSFEGQDPIELMKSLMLMHKLKSKHMIDVLGVSKEVVAGIINYKRGLTKENIQMLSKRFGIAPEAFSRPYKLRAPVKKGYSGNNRIITK